MKRKEVKHNKMKMCANSERLRENTVRLVLFADRTLTT